jgi:hypothetical protein
LDAPEEGLVFEIAHDFVAICDLGEIGQAVIKERLEVVFLPAGGDRVYDLVEIQIAKEVRRRLELFPSVPASGSFEQDALEAHVRFDAVVGRTELVRRGTRRNAAPWSDAKTKIKSGSLRDPASVSL